MRTTNQALAALAMWLRTVRANSGLTYRSLAELADCHATTLQRAASGVRVPSRDVVIAYATACGARADHAEQLWKEARYEARRSARGRHASLTAPRPELVRDFADLGAVLVELYDKAGAPPLREMEARAGGYGLLPRSTAHRIVNKQTIPQSRAQFEAFLRACDVHGVDQKPWLEAWKRAWQGHAGVGDDIMSPQEVSTLPVPAERRLPSPRFLRGLAAAGYELLSWHTSDPAAWRVRCTVCLRPVTLEVNKMAGLRECRCRVEVYPHEVLQEDSIIGNSADGTDRRVTQAMQELELARSRLRAPLSDPTDEIRAVTELRAALQKLYVAMAEHGRIDTALRHEAQRLLNRSTDLLAWVEAEVEAQHGIIAAPL
ncbi:helix-turn-helix domain-containing protein [Streptomyces sp. NA02950]|uniref:helix-turn-helix domain-containing protein n=1 Tax=Streptomyces sp. NA02950 TaxID=2742137 RepID=UPI00158FB63E|nr:helix-turn-helix transcriptional regulator [Streptomyces sp. NA02950]QKV90454.1 helix-turn-helix domain-containing protein [Streptomyces sp. NA02950]